MTFGDDRVKEWTTVLCALECSCGHTLNHHSSACDIVGCWCTMRPEDIIATALCTKGTDDIGERAYEVLLRLAEMAEEWGVAAIR